MFTFYSLSNGVVCRIYHFNTLRECVDMGRNSSDFICLNGETDITNQVLGILAEELK